MEEETGKKQYGDQIMRKVMLFLVEFFSVKWKQYADDPFELQTIMKTGINLDTFFHLFEAVCTGML